MREQRFLYLFLALGTALCVLNLSFYFFKTDPPSPSYLAQNTYLGPTVSSPKEDTLIRIELLVRDSAKADGVQIQSVTFDGVSVPLKPRDVLGKRGEASFQLPPGTYTLEWVVQKDKIVWPRLITHKESVEISPRALWMQILIEGDEVFIN